MPVTQTESRYTIEREGMLVVPDGAKSTVNGNGKAWEWLWRALSIVAIPWAAWFSMMLIDVRERVAVIEGNRFTSQNAYELMTIINRKADRNEVPPKWFLDRFEHLEEEFEKHRDRKDHP
jgi:hypothetical protein